MMHKISASDRNRARRDAQTFVVLLELPTLTLNAQMARSARSCLHPHAVVLALLTFTHSLFGEDLALSDLFALVWGGHRGVRPGPLQRQVVKLRPFHVYR